MTAIDAFQLLTAREPFPWQQRLLKKWEVADFTDDILRLETGTGKTSTIAIWLAALAANPARVPRRLVYVVNRRTVVDQTTSEVEDICERLRGTQLDSMLRSLSTISLDSNEVALAVSTLRGQLADNQNWSADPARPSVIVGTVDMIGSRLLFSGYGIGWKTRPLHAGFLGQDTIILHDECHLEPAFQSLLESIRFQQRDSFRPAKIIALSATPRKGQGTTFELSKDDYDDPTLKKRLHALKKLTIHPLGKKSKSLSESISKKALEYTANEKPILIYTNKVEDALKIAETLQKACGETKGDVRLLTGTMRGLERDKLMKDTAFIQFLPGRKATDSRATFLVATSAGEVGVNLSSAHLVCDLVSYERMAQRLGRLNRFGEFDEATVDVFHAEEQEEQLEATRLLLEELNGDASPANLSKLDVGKRDAASSPLPEIIPATDILFDALSLTSIRDLPSKPSTLDSFLHGDCEKEKPRTTIAWRDEVARIQDDLLEKFPPEELLESFRLKPHETLSDRADRVLKELQGLAVSQSEQPIWLVDHSGKVQIKKMGNLRYWKTLDSPIVILPPAVGGLSAAGTLDANAPAPEVSLDVSCHYGERHRTWDIAWPGQEWKLVQRIEFDSEETEEPSVWSWYERAWGGDGEGRQTSQTVYLDEHQNDVETLALAMAKSLGFPPELCEAVKLSTRWHDRGKSRSTWQASAGNTELRAIAKPLRKSSSRAGFRHELSSLVDIQADPVFLKLTNEQREIVQHVIATHHGRARPVFPAKELNDPETPSHLVKQLTNQVPLRFADLQKKFGHWGLAYLESILRAADYAASAGRKPNESQHD